MTKEIELTRGYVALVDDEDYEELSKYRWHAVPVGKYVYAMRRAINPRTGRNSAYPMHRHILGLGFGDKRRADHIDGNTMNYGRDNLRVCTHAENMRNRRVIGSNNTSGYKGVHRDTQAGKWRARISYNGTLISLGHFDDAEDAARAYDAAARKLHGNFARLNFPDEAP